MLAEGSCTDNTTVFGNIQGVSQAGNMSTNLKREPVGKRASGTYGNCWDGTITNPSNPQRRDVQMLLPGNFIVVQWNQDNPGVWP